MQVAPGSKALTLNSGGLPGCDSPEPTLTPTPTPGPPATITVFKVYSDNTHAAVSVTLTCDSGTVSPPGTGSVGSAMSEPGSPPVFSVSAFDPGATCTATEEVPLGYSETDDCTGIAIAPGDAKSCTITNTLITPTPT